MNKKLKYILFILSAVVITSCSDFFETNPDDILLGDDYIADANEFTSGFLGLASTVQDVYDQFIILSELRGDLLEPTVNAPQGLWEIYNYTNEVNEYTNPSGFYNIVVNANDFIKNAIIYKQNNPSAIADDDFVGIISSTIRFKVWAYLMIGKLYGEAVYYDDPMVEYNPNHDYPTLQFDELIDQLLTLMQEGVTFIKPASDTVAAETIVVTGLELFSLAEYIANDGDPDPSWDLICPDAECLNIELELWNEDYDAVITDAMEFLYADGSTKQYKITLDEYNNEWFSDIFTGINDQGLLTSERISATFYDYDNGQSNDLLRFFSNQAPNKYYLKPSQAAMDRFNNQYKENGVEQGDQYRGLGKSFSEVDGQMVYRKLTHYYEDDATLVYKTVDNIYMYRASDIHFFLMEALNQKSLFKEAEALLNNGMNLDYYLKSDSIPVRYPFDDPLIKDAWTNNKYPNTGIRDRVSLSPVHPSIGSPTTYEDTLIYQQQLDSLILEETCLESNGEARSYYAMIRMAKRWNDPSIVADRVSAKYSEGKKDEVYQRLMEPENWFINYPLGKIE